MKIYLTVLIALTLSGCASVVDHTNSKPLQHLLGKKTLTEAVWVCEETDSNETSTDTSDLQLIQTRGREGMPVDFRIIATLNAGDAVEINRVEEIKHRFPFCCQRWMLCGEFDLEGEKVVFRYNYASTVDSPEYPTEFIHDTPWK